MAKGTVSVELASGAEKAAAAEPEALWLEAYGKAGVTAWVGITAARRGPDADSRGCQKKANMGTSRPPGALATEAQAQTKGAGEHERPERGENAKASPISPPR
jgi:hypothetical protein